MPEPHSSTAAGLAAGAGLSLTTTFLGAQVDALMVGLVAAILASIMLDTIDTRPKAFAAVLLSALTAAYLPQVLVGWLASNIEHLGGGEPLRMVLALVVGASGPTVIPVGVERIKGIVGGAK